MNDKILQEINGKLDAIMKHIGCDYSGGPNQQEYMGMSNDDKDKVDEGQILGKT